MTVRALRRGSIAASRVTAAAGLSVALLEQNATTTGTDPVVSGSVSPTANALVVVWVAATNAGGVPATCTGCGITFTREAQFYDGINRTVAVFAGSSATPTAGAITVDMFAAPTGHAYRIEEWTGPATPAVLQTKTGNGSGATSAALTLDSAPAAGSATAGLFLVSAIEAITAGDGFTAGLHSSYDTPVARAFTEHTLAPADGVVDCSWVSSRTWSAVVAEIGESP